MLGAFRKAGAPARVNARCEVWRRLIRYFVASKTVAEMLGAFRKEIFR